MSLSTIYVNARDIIKNKIATRAISSAVLLAAALLVYTSPNASAAPNPEKVVGPNECGECHRNEVQSWKHTHHYKTFRTMPRTKEAKQISKKMGIRRIRNDSDCLACHYTSKQKSGRAKPIAGISCESCHGPAKNWLNAHSNFGGNNVKRENETPQHKNERLAKVDAAGMIRPGDIYKLAANCYQCHTVPHEKLVNVGGHSHGSDFELVSWSQGEVLHNYLRSPSGKENVESDARRKRLMYVIGNAVDLEYSLRGVAKATIKASYAVKMARRAQAAIHKLEKIQATRATPEVAAMIKAGDDARLRLNNEKELTAAADKVAKLAKKFQQRYNGSELAPLDALIPTKYKGVIAH
jgi:hypothetical protein